MALVVKNLPAWRRHRRLGFNSWVRKIPWRRKWQPTPVFLPGESHGQRSLEGYCPWDHQELDKTEQVTHTHSTATEKQKVVARNWGWKGMGNDC